MSDAPRLGLHRMALALAGALCMVTGCQNLHNKNHEAAQARWSRARANVQMQLAQQQADKGSLDKALITLGKAIQMDPNYAQLQVLRGQVLAEQGKGSEAVSAYELAIALAPTSAPAHYQLAVQLERFSQFEKALEHYQAALQIAPTSVPYATATAEMLGQLNRTGEALVLIDRMLKIHEQSLVLRVTAGELSMARAEYELACKYFREAARLATDDDYIIRSLAMSLYHCGQYALAKRYLEQLANRPADQADGKRSAEEGDGRSELLSALGDCHLVAGDSAKARDCFEQVARLHPDQAGAWENLGKVALHDGRWGDALSAADRAVALAPKSSTAHLLRGFALSNQGYAAEASSAFLSAHQLAPNDVLMLCLLSQSYQRLGNRDAARGVLVRALQIAPTDPLANRMMNALADARPKPGEPKPASEQPTATAGVAVPQ